MRKLACASVAVCLTALSCACAWAQTPSLEHRPLNRGQMNDKFVYKINDLNNYSGSLNSDNALEAQIRQAEKAFAANRNKEAIALWQALYQRCESLKANDPRRMLIVARLASLYLREDQPEQVETLWQSFLSIQEKELLPDDPAIAQTLYALGLRLHQQNKLDAARPLLERALAIRDQKLRPQDPQIELNLFELASVMATQHHFNKAQILLERLVRINEQKYGTSSLQTAEVLYSLVSDLYAQSKYQQAQVFQERLLEFMQKNWGPNTPGVWIL